ncbi:putative zinc-finger DNA binding protein [Dasineura jujubifolia toursvirus 2a]|nr:putative zinc-finger DNA binding protein [Dasineura jujubifolia toursvirus 2a]
MSHKTKNFINHNNNSSYCFWDKHPFEGNGVMCPISYKPKQIVHKKKEYYINQNVIRTKLNSDISSNDTNSKFKIEEEINYSDKFCSIPCLISWIEDQWNNPIYNQSKYILNNECLRNGIEIPKCANHWKTLKSFGGFLTIDEFRTTNILYKLIDSKYNKDGYKEEFYKENINIE